MAGFRPLLVTMALVALFAMCLLAFAMQFIGANNPSAIANDTTLNVSYNNLNANLNGLESGAKGIQEAVQKDRGDPVMIFLILKSMLTLPWQLVSLVINGFSTVMFLVFNNVFGGQFLVVMAAINGIIIITIIVLAVKYIRTGESER